MNKSYYEKGAVIVEATLVIPMFIFLVITIMWVANLCTAQAKIQIAINSAAKEISSYSYLYGLTGLNEKRATLKDKGTEGTVTANEVISGVKDIFSGLSSVSDSGQQALNGNLNDAYTDAEDGFSQLGTGSDSLNSAYEAIKKDPKSFMVSLGNASANIAVDAGSSYLSGAMGKYFSEKHLNTSTVSANDYLKKLGVVNGFDGINFSHSRFCIGGSDDIVIVAEYQLSPIKFFNIDVKYNIVQTGRTKAWFGVSQSDNKNGD